MKLFIRFYPLLETLQPVPQWGRYHHLLREINVLTFPVGREPIRNMSHLVAVSFLRFPLVGWQRRMVEGCDCCSTSLFLCDCSVDIFIVHYEERERIQCVTARLVQ